MSKAQKSLEVRKTFSSESSLSRRKFWKPVSVVSLPNLIEVQVNSYDWLLEKGIKELFDEINPISDFTEKDMDLIFKEYYLDDPKYDELTAKSKNISYEAPLRTKIQLIIKKNHQLHSTTSFFLKSVAVKEIKKSSVLIEPFPIQRLHLEAIPIPINSPFPLQDGHG